MVFPTQVGVILSLKRKNERRCGIPHASGGDPDLLYRAVIGIRYSPRKWG